VLDIAKPEGSACWQILTGLGASQVDNLCETGNMDGVRIVEKHVKRTKGEAAAGETAAAPAPEDYGSPEEFMPMMG